MAKNPNNNEEQKKKRRPHSGNSQKQSPTKSQSNHNGSQGQSANRVDNLGRYKVTTTDVKRILDTANSAAKLVGYGAKAFAFAKKAGWLSKLASLVNAPEWYTNVPGTEDLTVNELTTWNTAYDYIRTWSDPNSAIANGHLMTYDYDVVFGDPAGRRYAASQLYNDLRVHVRSNVPYDVVDVANYMVCALCARYFLRAGERILRLINSYTVLSDQFSYSVASMLYGYDNIDDWQDDIATNAPSLRIFVESFASWCEQQFNFHCDWFNRIDSEMLFAFADSLSPNGAITYLFPRQAYCYWNDNEEQFTAIPLGFYSSDVDGRTPMETFIHGFQNLMSTFASKYQTIAADVYQLKYTEAMFQTFVDEPIAWVYDPNVNQQLKNACTPMLSITHYPSAATQAQKLVAAWGTSNYDDITYEGIFTDDFTPKQTISISTSAQFIAVTTDSGRYPYYTTFTASASDDSVIFQTSDRAVTYDVDSLTGGDVSEMFRYNARFADTLTNNKTVVSRQYFGAYAIPYNVRVLTFNPNTSTFDTLSYRVPSINTTANSLVSNLNIWSNEAVTRMQFAMQTKVLPHFILMGAAFAGSVPELVSWDSKSYDSIGILHDTQIRDMLYTGTASLLILNNRHLGAMPKESPNANAQLKETNNRKKE